MADNKAKDSKLAVPKDAESTTSSKDTGYVKGDDTFTRWRNIFAIVSGQMTDQGKEQFRLARDIQFEQQDCRRCESYRDYLLKYSPIIRFLNTNIAQLNGDLNSTNIRCQRCTYRHGGGFSLDAGIKICANEMRNRGHMEDTLAHEMIHAYDYLRFKLEWSNLRHAACTEIRASSLSGECRFMREFHTRGQWKVTRQHQECVRRRAAISVASHPLCRDQAQANSLVNEVWDSCFADTRPFDEIYR